jgi:hypothetical protein
MEKFIKKTRIMGRVWLRIKGREDICQRPLTVFNLESKERING